jgi:uncharacterized protein
MTSFNVSGLLREPPGSVRAVRLRDHYVSLGPDVELAGPLDADLQLQRTNRGILMRGDVDASLRRTCARCTDPFVEDVTVLVSEEFLPTLDPVSGTPLGTAQADDTTHRVDAHHEIHLDTILHDELALTEPMHPLCSPSCPGLCVECGERLDNRHEPHADADIDPRLASLAALLGTAPPDTDETRN